MAADNNLDGAASRDLLEMVAANRNGAANVTVFLDRAEPDAYQLAILPVTLAPQHSSQMR